MPMKHLCLSPSCEFYISCNSLTGVFSDPANRIAHELTRIIFNFRREGFLETVGPAGTPEINYELAVL